MMKREKPQLHYLFVLFVCIGLVLAIILLLTIKPITLEKQYLNLSYYIWIGIEHQSENETFDLQLPLPSKSEIKNNISRIYSQILTLNTSTIFNYYFCQSPYGETLRVLINGNITLEGIYFGRKPTSDLRFTTQQNDKAFLYLETNTNATIRAIILFAGLYSTDGFGNDFWEYSSITYNHINNTIYHEYYEGWIASLVLENDGILIKKGWNAYNVFQGSFTTTVD
ncbi:MAG: hypothetical protein QXQ54_08125 [Thermoplasmata archaeon]